LEKIKHLEFLKYPTCTAKTMAGSVSKTRSKFIEKPLNDGKSIVKKSFAGLEKSISVEPKSKLIEAEKNVKNNQTKTERASKPVGKSEDKKDSPPTPKKSIAETKIKAEKISRRAKSPTTAPAKSDKEANNRKVLESKEEKTRPSTLKSVPRREVVKEPKAVPEKRPLVKRAKPQSTAKPSPPVSPKKQLKPKSSPKKIMKKENKTASTSAVKKVIKNKDIAAINTAKDTTEETKPDEPTVVTETMHVEIEAADDVLTATIVKETEGHEEQIAEPADSEVPESQAEDVTEEDILSEKQADGDEKISEAEGDVDTQVEEDIVTDDGENKHIRDEEESEKERAKKDAEIADRNDDKKTDVVEVTEENNLETPVNEEKNQSRKSSAADIEVAEKTSTPELIETGDEPTEGVALESELACAEMKAENEAILNNESTVEVAVELSNEIVDSASLAKNDDLASDAIEAAEDEVNEKNKDQILDEAISEANISAASEKDDEKEKLVDGQPIESKEECAVVDIEEVNRIEGILDDDKLISEETKQKIEGEVKEIITSAQSKIAEDDGGLIDKKTSPLNENGPKTLEENKEDKSSEKLKEDTPQEDKKEIKIEEANNTKSQPDEKLSAMETSATTAPSMPEDEKIDDKLTLDEIKEEKQAEEKVEILEVRETPPPSIQPLRVIQLEQTQLQHHRDLVKTPDEVADLPMHEEVDAAMYESVDDKKAFSDKLQDGEIPGVSKTQITDKKEDSDGKVELEAEKKNHDLKSTEHEIPKENIVGKESNNVDEKNETIVQHSQEDDKLEPQINEKTDKLGEKEMQKSAIDEKEVDTSLEEKKEQTNIETEPENDATEEVDAIPTGEFHQVLDGIEANDDILDEKKDEEKKSSERKVGFLFYS